MAQSRRRPLTRERIVRTALRLVDRHGLEALSMRTLAQALGVGTMSLYNHVPNKAALLDAIAGRVLAEMELPSANGTDWATSIKAIMASFRHAARRHPNVLPLLTRSPLSTPEALRAVDLGFATLRRAGFDAETSVHLYRLLAGYAFGFLTLELGGFFDAAGGADEGALPPAADALFQQFPTIAELAPYFLRSDAGAEFELGLDLILSAVRAEREQT